MQENIHPIFKNLLSRCDKERHLNQRAIALWLTGLSCSGKSTIAQHLENLLYTKGFFSQVLDGDNLRTGICKNLGFSIYDRLENIRRVAEVSKLFLNSGIITINTFISPTYQIRSLAKDIIGSDDFVEIYINAPLDVCEKRDVKGLYDKARNGLISGFTGIDQTYEVPIMPDIEIRTDRLNVEESVDCIYNHILPKITKIN